MTKQRKLFEAEVHAMHELHAKQAAAKTDHFHAIREASEVIFQQGPLADHTREIADLQRTLAEERDVSAA